MNEFEILKINYDMVKKDLQNNSIDLYVAKIELQTIVLKMSKIIKKDNSNEKIEFLHTAQKLLDEVNFNITSLSAQEIFDSYTDEV